MRPSQMARHSFGAIYERFDVCGGEKRTASDCIKAIVMFADFITPSLDPSAPDGDVNVTVGANYMPEWNGGCIGDLCLLLQFLYSVYD